MSLAGPKLAGLMLLAGGLLPQPAMGQSRLEIIPALSVAHVYDDNLFARPSAEQRDFILRLSPRVHARYRSATLSVAARYALDAERYQEHPELNAALARQEAALDVGWLLTRRVDATLAVSYASTQIPGELNLVTGIEIGRGPARRLEALGSLSMKLGALTTATFDPAFTREEIAGAVNDTIGAGLGLQRRLGPAATGRIGYRLRVFTFPGQATTSHVLTVGWRRTVGSANELELLAGPRLTGTELGAEMSASVRHRFHRGDVALTYVQTQATVLGEHGPVMADGVSAAFTRQLARPFRIAIGPSVFRTRGAVLEATVFRLSLDLAWRLSRRLSLAGSHQFSLQRGTLGDGAQQDVSHNAVLLSLVSGS